MKNNKAFTLVELIVIMVIIGVIMVFALPNVTSTLQRNKKDSMISDAKDMVEKAKNHMLKKGGYPTTTGASTVLSLGVIDPREEIKDSPYGKLYIRSDSGGSKVTVTLEENETSVKNYKYTVCLTDGSYKINAPLEELLADSKYEKVIPGTSCS